jgi:hypothetical protein
MRVVYKFVVPFASIERHGNPAPTAPLTSGARTLCAGMDPETGNPAVWVELDPGAERRFARFVAYATGDQIPDDAVYVGTAECGSCRWHVYERRA